MESILSLFSRMMEIAAAGNFEEGGAPAPEVDPPTFDPTVPAIPVSYPIKTLEELESRVYFDSFHFPFNQATVKLPSSSLARRPRILVCHDMAGGYMDDRFVQGWGNADAYAIWHWSLIDVFVYFSHSLVTLPPPCWVNAAHRHGVKVLGTFIVEHSVGNAIASKVLSSKDSVRMYAARLTELAVSLGFDGWLLNVEVSLDPKQIPNLKEFVSCLTQSMHSSLPGSLVIWYDSVTVDGYLLWQDQLNDKNQAFFDLCDGIFTNYSWEEDFAKLSADAAGNRKYDVYMGIDVFGRGTYGGGQWTTNVALDVIKEADVSAAIFAPGWVSETKQPPDFQTAQNRWWGLVEKSCGIMQHYPKMLPFYSNFDQGRGYHIASNGKQISGIPWNNISSQTFQPFLESSEDKANSPIRVFVDFSEASFNGGGNITFTGTLNDGTSFSTRLFLGHLLVGSSPIKFTYSVRASVDCQLGLVLEFSSSSQEKKSVFLAAPGNTLLTMNQFSNPYTSVVMPSRVTKLEKQDGWSIQETNVNMTGYILKEIRAICYKTRHSTEAASLQYHAVLGDLRISNGEDNDSNFPSADSWLVDASFISWTSNSEGSKLLSLKISWQLKVGNADLFPKYNIYIYKGAASSSDDQSEAVEYLGAAFVNAFYVSELRIPSGSSTVKFIVQVCGLDGAQQKILDSPFFLLQAGNL